MNPALVILIGLTAVAAAAIVALVIRLNRRSAADDFDPWEHGP